MIVLGLSEKRREGVNSEFKRAVRELHNYMFA